MPRALARNHESIPGPGSIIAASFTSPLDVLYLTAIFDPIFTASHPDSLLVRPLSLFSAVQRAFASPEDVATPASGVDVPTLLRTHPERPIVIFPECTTTNGRGVLPFAPSLLATPRDTPIFPVSLRYTAADVTTPVPGAYLRFLWNFLSKPTHCIRVRIARSEFNTRSSQPAKVLEEDGRTASPVGLRGGVGADPEKQGQPGERKTLDRVADALARLGRVQRVGLGIEEKRAFLKAWTKSKKQR